MNAGLLSGVCPRHQVLPSTDALLTRPALAVFNDNPTITCTWHQEQLASVSTSCCHHCSVQHHDNNVSSMCHAAAGDVAFALISMPAPPSEQGTQGQVWVCLKVGERPGGGNSPETGTLYLLNSTVALHLR
jgi:hypothetical protein